MAAAFAGAAGLGGLDDCSNRNQLPDLIPLGVGQRDAAVRPVDEAVKAAKPCQSVLDPVNHNAASGRKSLQRGALTMLRVATRDVQGEMKPASRVSAVQDVNSFARLVISCTHFLGPQDSGQSIPGKNAVPRHVEEE